MAESIRPEHFIQVLALPRDPYAELAGFLTRKLQSARIPLTDEIAAQAAISRLLDELEVKHKREHRLSPHERLDFWLPEPRGDAGEVIEVKMNAARPASIVRQLARYAAHPCVRALYLVSNRAMDLPADIGGKPAFLISLGRAWL
ncbi:MAG TPA: hypothetical protein VHZ78_08655 [Rhizomicrobium sp.]|jgi:hypothetical protein|nr:hypothetical protein [Rhizomicrobium sp.]